MPLSVFLVDDSALIRQRLRRLVSCLDNADVVGEAACLASLPEALERTQANVVLLDIRLHDGNGLDAVAGIQGLKRPPEIIIVSGFGEKAYRERAASLGITAFYEKGTQFQDLQDHLLGMAKACA